MGGNLRARLEAGRLQRTLAMRMLRVASASVLSLLAVLTWNAAEFSAPRTDPVDASTAVSSAVATHAGVVAAGEEWLSSHKAARSTRVGSRPLLLARSRATDGEGDLPQTVALASRTAAQFRDVAESSRARLRRLSLGHAPYGETSPFDATAPPVSSPRNG